MDKYKHKGGNGQSYKFKGAKAQTCIEGCANSRVQNLWMSGLTIGKVQRWKYTMSMDILNIKLINQSIS